MSYHEKRAIVSALSMALIPVIYFAIVLKSYPAGSAYSVEVFHFWGLALLVLIPVSIAARIAIDILFRIANRIATNEKEPSFRDERDRLIELRALQMSHYTFMVGYVVAMISLVSDKSPATMFTILVIAGAVSAVVSELLRFYYYHRGFQDG